jgi:hypothetical protein
MPAIWRVGDDGEGLARLPGSGEDGRHDGEPDVSRDGTVIAVRRGRYNGRTGAIEEPNGIWIMPAAGGPGVRVPPPPSDAPYFDDAQPSLSPDGRRVVFARLEGSAGGRDLWVTGVDGRGAMRLTATDGDEQNPTFSPDGRKIAFTVPGGYQNFTLGLQTGVYVMDPDGANVAPLVAGTASVAPTGIAWAPDGSAIALTIGTLAIVPLDGGGGRPLFGQSGTGPTFGPDATTLFAVAPDFAASSMTLRRIDLDAGRERTLVSAHADAPDWSGALAPLRPVLDALGPVIAIGNELPRPGGVPAFPPAPRVTAAARKRRPRIVARRGRVELPFLADDRSGVRRIQAAIARRVRRRCRFATGTRWSPARPCVRPVWIDVRDPAAWRSGLASLRRGRYLVALRATDAHGNTTRRPRRVDLRVGR